MKFLLKFFGSRCMSCGKKDWNWNMNYEAFWVKHPDCPSEFNYGAEKRTPVNDLFDKINS